MCFNGQLPTARARLLLARTLRETTDIGEVVQLVAEFATRRLRTSDLFRSVHTEESTLCIVRKLLVELGQQQGLSYLMTAGTLYNAACHGYVSVVEAVHGSECGARCTYNSWQAELAAKHGRVSLVSFFYHHKPVLHQSMALRKANKDGHLEVVQFCRKIARLEYDVKMAAPAAARAGRLQLLQFWDIEDRALAELERREQHSWGDQVKSSALDGGHLCIVKWLHKNRSEMYDSVRVEIAAECGYLKVVKYLHAHGIGHWSARVMEAAVASGNGELVQFLQAARRGRDVGGSGAAVDGQNEGKLRLPTRLATE